MVAFEGLSWVLLTASCDSGHTRSAPFQPRLLSATCERSSSLAAYTNSPALPAALLAGGEKLFRPKSAVLFRGSERAFGMFVVLRGMVRLDFGADSIRSRSYGPGTLVGLPATITRSNYLMTATVTEDAELLFWSSKALELLLHERPELCQQLLVIMGERLAEHQEIMKASLEGD